MFNKRSIIYILIISLFLCRPTMLLAGKVFIKNNHHVTGDANSIQSKLKTDNEIVSIIHKNSEKYNVEHSLIAAIIKVESNFNKKAVSIKGAKGLMQLMPDTYRSYRVTNAFDPDQNIQVGTSYFRKMMDRFKRIDLALAAYNAGPGAVEKYDKIPPFKETKLYVRQVMHYYRLYKLNKKIVKPITQNIKNDSRPKKQPDITEEKLIREETIYRRKIFLNPKDLASQYKLASIYQELGKHYKEIIILRKIMSNEIDTHKLSTIKNRINLLKIAYKKEKGIRHVHFSK